MGTYTTKTKTMLLLLTPILLLPLLISSSSGVYVSNGKRSQPYEFQGKLPEYADLVFKNLHLCNVFHNKTCCSVSRMLSASSALENLATYGEASKDCLYLFELLECSICHPDVGTQSEPIRICASFCDSVFEACSDAYFSISNQVIVPCGASEGIICEKASKLETNGTAFCEAVGFTVQTDEPCYGSKSILVTVVEFLKKTWWLHELQFILQMYCSGLLFVLTIMFLNMKGK